METKYNPGDQIMLVGTISSVEILSGYDSPKIVYHLQETDTPIEEENIKGLWTENAAVAKLVVKLDADRSELDAIEEQIARLNAALDALAEKGEIMITPKVVEK